MFGLHLSLIYSNTAVRTTQNLESVSISQLQANLEQQITDPQKLSVSFLTLYKKVTQTLFRKQYRAEQISPAKESSWTLGDRLCGLVVRVSGYRYRGPGFDPRRCQIF